MEIPTLPENAVSEALATLFKHVPINTEEEHPDLGAIPSSPIDQLKTQGKRLETISILFSENIKRRIAIINRQINRFSPINWLPTEILAYIFRILVDSSPLSQIPSQVITKLTKVSSHWLDVAISNPRLWSDLDSRDSQLSVVSGISRSRQAPLRVFIDGSKHRLEEVQDFLRLIEPHLHRVEMLECTRWGPPHKVLSKFLENGSFPLLKHFKVLQNASDYREQLPEGILHKAPWLQTLHLFQFPLPSGSPSFSEIRSISFTSFDGNLPSAQQWCDLLASTPQLEHLRVEKIYRGQDASGYTGPFHVSLPFLKTLTLVWVRPPFRELLLSWISFNRDSPPSIYITGSITSYHQYDAFPDIISPAVNSDSNLLTLLRQATPLVIRARDSGLKDKMEIEAWTLEQPKLLRYQYWIRDPVVPALLHKNLASMCIISNLHEMELDGTFLLHDQFFSPILHLFVALEKLTLRRKVRDFGGPAEDVRRICKRLAFPDAVTLSDGSISYVWPCPKLKYLTVLTYVDYPVLINFARARYGDKVVASNTGELALLEGLTLADEIVNFWEGDGTVLVEKPIHQIKSILDPLGTSVRIVGLGKVEKDNTSTYWTQDRLSHLDVFRRED
ncbi:hypothetical protein FRC03_007257 [Tulasnella sp. 419]|nr:hypothetical protein FRC03_007257 [Tulasnella sp. 419]